MIARANLVRQTYPGAIVVPIFATVLLDDQRFVMVERDGIAEVRPVEAGVVQGSMVQITKGVSPGDRLIVVGHKDVRPGERVNVTETLP
jgi:membrane fusion protein (multidrug efflux system)